MSEMIARQAMSRMHLREQAIAEHYQGMVFDMQQLARANPEEEQQKYLDNTRAELCEMYGFSRSEQRKPFAFANGIAIIPVHGTLINRFGGSYSYVTGYNFIRSQHNLALMDDEVTHIVHDHNSYGGEAAGCFELSTDIFNSRGKKPIIAMVDSNSYSASYALATACDKVIVTPSSGVGSVGVVATHMNVSKMMKDWGIEITYIFSGDHKVDGNPYEALSADVKANIQKGIDKSRAVFVSVVARNLGIDSKIVYDTQAATYRADDALALKLIHGIAAPAAALEMILAGDDEVEPDEVASTPQTIIELESDMTTAEAAAVAATPAAAAAPTASAADLKAAERERCGAITGCEEAKGREALANHIAFKTDMSAADAKAMLAISPTGAAGAAAAPAATAVVVVPAAAAATNPFDAAMSASANPNVGAGAAAAEAGGAKLSAADEILRDYALASGVVLK